MKLWRAKSLSHRGTDERQLIFRVHPSQEWNWMDALMVNPYDNEEWRTTSIARWHVAEEKENATRGWPRIRNCGIYREHNIYDGGGLISELVLTEWTLRREACGDYSQTPHPLARAG